MSITLGSLILFVLIIFPGIVFRRLYFTGEFSKQFDHSTIWKLLYNSIVAGIIIQFLSILTANYIFKYHLSFDKIFSIIHDLSNSKQSAKMNPVTNQFLRENFNEFIAYFFLVLLVAGLSGYILNQIVRFFDLDVKIKLFRYRNQWYYVFSGKILRFKKFKEAISTTNASEDDIDITKPILTVGNILVRLNEQQTCLYTGFIVDYDLKPNNISELQRIYLAEISKKSFRKPGEISDSKNYPRNIPGKFFVIPGKDIINYNINYIPSLVQIAKIERRKEILSKIKQIVWGIIDLISIIIIFLFIGIEIIYAFKSFTLGVNWLDTYLSSTRFWGKLFFTFGFIQFLILISPKYDEKINKYYYSYSWKELLRSISVLIIFSGLYWLLR